MLKDSSLNAQYYLSCYQRIIHLIKTYEHALNCALIKEHKSNYLCIEMRHLVTTKARSVTGYFEEIYASLQYLLAL
jgi:hypothetical protein